MNCCKCQKQIGVDTHATCYLLPDDTYICATCKNAPEPIADPAADTEKGSQP